MSKLLNSFNCPYLFIFFIVNTSDSLILSIRKVKAPQSALVGNK